MGGMQEGDRLCGGCVSYDSERSYCRRREFVTLANMYACDVFEKASGSKGSSASLEPTSRESHEALPYYPPEKPKVERSRRQRTRTRRQQNETKLAGRQSPRPRAGARRRGDSSPAPVLLFPTYEDALLKLEPRQPRFVREYLRDLNATAACRRAGYQGERLDQMGYENLRKPEIATAVQAGLRAVNERLDVRAEDVKRELGLLGRSDIGNYVKWGPNGLEMIPSDEIHPEHRAAIAEIEETIIPRKNGEPIRRLSFKLHEKKGALDSLAKHFGLQGDKGLTPEQVEAILWGMLRVIEKFVEPKRVDDALVELQRSIDGKYSEIVNRPRLP